VSVAFPSGTVAEFHENRKGDVFPDATIDPFARSSTRVTPTLSLALIETETVPETVDVLPFGDAIETLGGVASALDEPFATVTEAGLETVELPAASKATAVSATVPLATLAEFHANWKGEAVSVATVAPFARSSTRVTPTLSLALTETVTMPETLPPVGDAIATDGGAESPDPEDDACWTAAAAFSRPAP
jgi:hypothetical protein